MLCFMNVEEDFEMGFSKNHENFERSIQQLLYRMGGYYKNDAEKIIEQFKDNVSNDLRIYINDIIYNIFIDCLYFSLTVFKMAIPGRCHYKLRKTWLTYF